MSRVVRGVAVTAVVLLAASALAVLMVPIVRGTPSPLVIVSGHSMDPTLHTGDLVVAWPRSSYAVGDVAPYRVPAGQPGEGGMVIHRIVGGSPEDGFVMQGDNNPAPDIWMPRHHDIVGRQVLVVPRLGELMAWIRQPAVLAALVAGAMTAAMVDQRSGRLSRS